MCVCDVGGDGMERGREGEKGSYFGPWDYGGGGSGGRTRGDKEGAGGRLANEEAVRKKEEEVEE